MNFSHHFFFIEFQYESQMAYYNIWVVTKKFNSWLRWFNELEKCWFWFYLLELQLRLGYVSRLFDGILLLGYFRLWQVDASLNWNNIRSVDVGDVNVLLLGF